VIAVVVVYPRGSEVVGSLDLCGKGWGIYRGGREIRLEVGGK
jgi:hypothetical protein